MLSDMIRQHPHILSISEFFSFVSDIGGRIPDEFPAAAIDGARFWDVISALGPRSSLALRHDAVMPEVLYPYTDPGARYSAETGVPAILLVTLPHLTDAPDALFDEVREQVISRPAAPIRAHYDALFGWLTERFARQMWIERTGPGLMVLGQLHATFPEARFIHIVRDGRDTAISMHNHIGFRLFTAAAMLTEMLGVDPYESSDRTNIDQVPPPLRALLPERFESRALRQFRVPLGVCGQLWSQLVADGLKRFGQLPDDRVLTLRYEDFFVEPERQIDRLARFLGDAFVNRTWAKRCARMVRRPRSSWNALSKAEVSELQAACRPGLDALRGAGIVYPDP